MQSADAHRREAVCAVKRLPLRTLLLLIGMGLMLPCYLFTVGNVCLSAWPLYERNRVALVLLTALCTAGLCLDLRAAKRHEAFFARHERGMLLGFALFYLAVQLTLGGMLRFVPVADAEQCITAARLIVEKGTFGDNERSWTYFSRCTNNLGYVQILALCFRFFSLFGWTDWFMQLVLVNSLLFACGLLAGARVVRRLGGPVAQTRFLMLAVSCLPMLYCTTELYTDSFSVGFPLMILYCAMRVHEAQRRRDAALWSVLFALLSFVGAQMRFTALIASIAALIAMLLDRRALRALGMIALLAATMLAGHALLEAENNRHIAAEDRQARALPILHYIAMGLPVHEDEGYGQYGYGGWFLFTTSFDDPQERNAALLSEVIDRVYYLRYPNRLLNMLSRKNLSTFGDGTFQLNSVIEANEHSVNNPVKQVIFEGGRLHSAYYHLSTALFMAQLLLACLACAQAIRRRDTRGAALYIALVGAFILLSIWETNGRYFFQFQMLLLAAAALVRTEKTA